MILKQSVLIREFSFFIPDCYKVFFDQLYWLLRATFTRR